MKSVGVLKLQFPPGAGGVCIVSGGSLRSVNYLCANRLASEVTRLLLAQPLLVFEFNDSPAFTASQYQFMLIPALSLAVSEKCVTITARLFSHN